jgi:glycosyltransferase involved in cell wall biosynthesis
MKVAIDARILPGTAGGVAVAVKSLVQGLGQLADGHDEYVIVVASEEQRAWLAPVIGSNQRLVQWVRSRRSEAPFQQLVLRSVRPIVQYLRQLLDRRVWPEVPISDGFLEGLGCDVLHVPTQNFTLCAVPTIYNPHDLQHLHYPQFFTAPTLAWRETVYPAGCHFAHTVVVGSQWIKADVVKRYRIDPEKVQVVREAPPSQSIAAPSASDLERVKATHQLEQPFILFPGVTWPHKNHLGLLQALAQLRDERGITVRLVCTGSPYAPFWPRIEARLQELRLGGQVRFLGHVPESDLRALYRLATCLVMPSLYEASSLPIFDAWLDGLPVICSNATALPEQVRDAALLFDPVDPPAIADAIATVAGDPEMQAELRARGMARLKDFDLQRTARAYRAVYRRAAGEPLSDEDAWLLGSGGS